MEDCENRHRYREGEGVTFSSQRFLKSTSGAAYMNVPYIVDVVERCVSSFILARPTSPILATVHSRFNKTFFGFRSQ